MIVFIIVGVIFTLMLILAVVDAVRAERRNRDELERHLQQHREWYHSTSVLDTTNVKSLKSVEAPLSCDVSTDCSSCDAGCDGGGCGGD